MKEVKPIAPRNFGWLEVTLEDKEMDFLWKMIKNRGECNKKELAGNLSGSWIIPDEDDWFWENVLTQLCMTYAGYFRNLGQDIATSANHGYYLRSFWVNYQKQTEFNPLHDHTGIYSFVIWMQIPTEFKEQNKLPIAAETRSKQISNFMFEYRDIFGGGLGHLYEMSPKMEGKLLFFPSKLQHQVYPFFNCRKDRISISGNIGLDTLTRIPDEM